MLNTPIEEKKKSYSTALREYNYNWRSAPLANDEDILRKYSSLAVNELDKFIPRIYTTNFHHPERDIHRVAQQYLDIEQQDLVKPELLVRLNDYINTHYHTNLTPELTKNLLLHKYSTDISNLDQSMPKHLVTQMLYVPATLTATARAAIADDLEKGVVTSITDLGLNVAPIGGAILGTYGARNLTRKIPSSLGLLSGSFAKTAMKYGGGFIGGVLGGYILEKLQHKFIHNKVLDSIGAEESNNISLMDMAKSQALMEAGIFTYSNLVTGLGLGRLALGFTGFGLGLLGVGLVALFKSNFMKSIFSKAKGGAMESGRVLGDVINTYKTKAEPKTFPSLGERLEADPSLHNKTWVELIEMERAEFAKFQAEQEGTSMPTNTSIREKIGKAKDTFKDLFMSPPEETSTNMRFSSLGERLEADPSLHNKTWVELIEMERAEFAKFQAEDEARAKSTMDAFKEQYKKGSEFMQNLQDEEKGLEEDLENSSKMSVDERLENAEDNITADNIDNVTGSSGSEPINENIANDSRFKKFFKKAKQKFGDTVNRNLLVKIFDKTIGEKAFLNRELVNLEDSIGDIINESTTIQGLYNKTFKKLGSKISDSERFQKMKTKLKESERLRKAKEKITENKRIKALREKIAKNKHIQQSSKFLGKHLKTPSSRYTMILGTIGTIGTVHVISEVMKKHLKNKKNDPKYDQVERPIDFPELNPVFQDPNSDLYAVPQWLERERIIDADTLNISDEELRKLIRKRIRK